MWHTNIFLFQTLETSEIEYYKIQGRIEDLYSLHVSSNKRGHYSCIALPEKVLYIFNEKQENFENCKMEKCSSRIEDIVDVYLQAIKIFLLQKWTKKYNDFVFFK